jgi:hypothetical protein
MFINNIVSADVGASVPPPGRIDKGLILKALRKKAKLK